ncbi:MAG TPA: TerC/Alx family metal homeostasis membrane protein [Patescibacteria group bacterium]|nr:TerC/Alx family metal homeostasis membrane protein [Patescibacteria group bacterium]
MESILLSIFGVVIIGFLVADLGFFNRKAHKISPKSALLQSLFWIGISIGFAVLVYYFIDSESAAAFMSAYLTEKMLSVDNLFVILLIFSFFKLDEKYHHKVLFWGILGAIIFRAIFILAGSYIISQFHWVLYIFGAILIYTGIKLLKDKKEEHVNYHESKVLKFARKFLPFTTTTEHNGKFFIRENGKLHATIMFMIVLLVETTDIIFAVDSIPAAFSISQDPFIVFTSNIFAVLGLRALFFLIESVMHRFHHLQKGLSFILVFIGAKMLLGIFHVHISSLTSFLIIMLALALSLIASLLFPKKI